MTATVLEHIEGLDFDPELACEHSWHERTHVPGDPAAWVARGQCQGCGFGRTYLLCESGLEDLKRAGTTKCRHCALVAPWYEQVVILGPVRSP